MRNISLFFKSVCKFLLLIFFLGLTSSLKAQDASKGAAIFKQNCTACHALDKKVVGPALKGVGDRRSKEWLRSWIKNSGKLIASGDKDAVALFNEYNKVAMPAFPTLSDEEIDNMIAYFQEGDKKAPAAGGTTTDAGGTEAAAGAGKDDVSDFMLGGLILVIIAALLVIVVLNKVIKTLQRLLIQRQGGELPQESSDDETSTSDRFKELLKNKKFIFFLILLSVIFLGSWGWKTMWDTGVHQGYQPVQPIKFPHDVHAGVNKIDCQYCHSAAYKSKNASIPSANVCMNCHNHITASEKYGGQTSPEIMKIYKALDYNPETQKYGKNKKPIQWIRIHNLPDLAYFNHAVHVKVNGVKCQKCHGPVETMSEVYQYSPLTMKWCINCHRETEVNYKGNAYYDKLVAAHEKVKKGEKITAAVLGGTECARCHY